MCCRKFYNRVINSEFSLKYYNGGQKSMKDEQSERVNQILARVYEGEINPLQGVNEVDREIGGITGIDHRVGTNIRNHRSKISLQRRGLGKPETEKLEEFATLAYWKAQKNGSCFPGEVHLGKGISSKHYKTSFLNFQNNLLSNYLQAC